MVARCLLLTAAFLSLAATQAVAAAPCPPAAPLSDLRAATAGGATVPASGLTVSRGTVPEPFEVEVLGVLDDGIAPGVDLIVVEADSPAIDRARGIWAGMSGSPVHDRQGRLIGAVAYGFTAGPSKIGGVTPAEDMLRLLDAGTARAAAITPRRRVRLPAALRREVAAQAGVSARAAAAGLERLPIPLGVSGLRAQRLEAFAEELTGVDAPVIAHRASAVPARTEDPGAIVPGGNFAAALSTGDVSVAGVGTATAVCGTRALAFGHPLDFRGGGTTHSAHPATAVTIADDPTFAPFKLANVGGVVGLVDQDRLVGLRALLDRAPAATPITSTVTDADEGTTRDGLTSVNDDADVPGLAQLHLLANIDRVVDRIGSGRSRVTWTVTGRAGDEPFSLTRDNRFAVRVSAGTPFAPDIAVASTEELAAQLAQIEGNPFAPVVFTGLRIDAQVAREFRALQVEGMEREEGGDWVPVAEDAPLQVRAGAVLRLRVRLSSFRGTAGSPAVELALTVPALAPGAVGRLVVRGAGQADGGEEPLPPAEPEGASFTDLLDALRDAPRNDELVAELRFAEDADPSGEPASAARSRLGDVVTGAAGALVEVVE